MKKIAVISHESRMLGGMTILYPIYRWEKQLNENNLYFNIFTHHNDKRILDYEIVIVNSRYFQLMLNKIIIIDHKPVVEFLSKLRKHGIKIIFFEAGDSSGSDFFDIMEYVDLYLKKQLLKDKNQYLNNNGSKSLRVWITESDEESKNRYSPCRKTDLDKLKLGWNIGLVDYRYNPFKVGLISNHWFTSLKTSDSRMERRFLTAYRGSSHKNSIYAFQRNCLIKLLLETKLPVLTGKPVNRKEYLRELEHCKAVVSPYGWGEICYRDFEAFIKGAILIKPDMSHLETFPNLFQSGKTYLPVNWQMTDLEEKLNLVNDNYRELIEIAIQGQNNFISVYSDSELFVKHVKGIISAVI